jgi:hypothetical protein
MGNRLAPHPRRENMSKPQPSFARIVKRTIALGTVVVAALSVSDSVGIAAATPAHTTDHITYTGHIHLTPPLNGASRFVLVSDGCSISADEAAPLPCMFDGTGTVTPAGGHGYGIISSPRGVIVLDENFVFTSPATSVGTGSATEFGISPTTGSFVGTFTSNPTAAPSVLQNSGTITVTH